MPMFDTDRLLARLCDYQQLLWVLLTFLVFMLLLTLLPLLFGQPGTESYVIAVVDAVLILGFGIVILTLYVRCSRHDE